MPKPKYSLVRTRDARDKRVRHKRSSSTLRTKADVEATPPGAKARTLIPPPNARDTYCCGGDLLRLFSSYKAQIFLSILHFITGAVIVARGSSASLKHLGIVQILGNAVQLQSTLTNETVFDEYEDDDNVYVQDELLSVNLFHLDGIFLLFTGLAHAIYANGTFQYDVPRLSYKFRWIEYAISAPLMLVLIAILCGLHELYQLIMLAGLMATVMIFGWYGDRAYEFQSQGSPTVWPHPTYMGFIPYLFAWGCVIASFYQVLSQAQQKPPQFVYYVVIIMFVFYSLFGITQLYFLIWRHTEDALLNVQTYDGTLHLLSVCSKLTLALLVYFGLSNNAT